jgi:hypothetical protein
MTTRPMTSTMLDELRFIEEHGTFREMDYYGVDHLAFWRREKVLSGLIARGLIADAETITESGKEAIAKAQQ